MNDAIGKHFGLLIAYVLPGFVTIWALRPFSPEIDAWLRPSPTIPAGIDAVFFVLLASIFAGMTVSAPRWAVIDTLHHCTGLPRPDWDDANLPMRLTAFANMVEEHYRHYLFHANAAVAVAVFYASLWLRPPAPTAVTTILFVFLLLLFLATSRDNLRKYYGRTARLLGVLPPVERNDCHVQRQPLETVSAGQAAKGDQADHDRRVTEVTPS